MKKMIAKKMTSGGETVTVVARFKGDVSSQLKKEAEFKLNREEQSIGCMVGKMQSNFHFDRLFQHDTSNEEVYD